jgi:hypothetical protein
MFFPDLGSWILNMTENKILEVEFMNFKVYTLKVYRKTKIKYAE